MALKESTQIAAGQRSSGFAPALRIVQAVRLCVLQEVRGELINSATSAHIPKASPPCINFLRRIQSSAYLPPPLPICRYDAIGNSNLQPERGEPHIPRFPQ